MTEKNTLTIHRALAELKLIDSKIEKKTSALQTTSVSQKDKLIEGHIKKEDFEKNALSNYQSIVDLIDRKVKLKTAIVSSNSKTLVKIGGKEMTVADAITMKSLIEYKKKLKNNIESKFRQSKSKLEQQNAVVENNIQNLLEKTVAKEGKTDPSLVDGLRKSYLENNSWTLIDPLNSEEKIKELEEDISNFETEVDASLSESNATTVIEI